MSIFKRRAEPEMETTDEWKLYEKGVEYNRKINLYDTVDENEAYFAGEQWRGVDAGGLPTPVFNIFRRVINFFVASIMAQPLKLQYSPDGIPSQSGDMRDKSIWRMAELLNKYVEYRWEKDKVNALLSDALTDAAVTGDAVAYVYWDADVKTGQPYKGDFRTKIVDNVNVLLGDPNSREIDGQPYILLCGRELVTRLREEANANGGEPDKVVPDTDDLQNQSGDLSEYELADTKATTIVKFWRDENGRILWRKATRSAVIRQDVDTRLKNYPVALMNWDRRKNSWHGRGVIDGLIQNQRYINKSFALLMKHMMDTAFSKTIYDSTRIDQWLPGIGESIPSNGDVNGTVATVGVGQVQSGYMDVIQLAESMTRDLMGASDAALGNVKPENTSAIIALQQATAVPLENVKRNMCQFVEDIGLIWLDYMLAYYTDGRMLTYSEDGETVTEPMGQSKLPGMPDIDGAAPDEEMPAYPTEGDIGAAPIERVQNPQEPMIPPSMQPPDTMAVEEAAAMLWDARVDVGPSHYWSELACIQTLDNLLRAQVIDVIQYLERMPDTVIPQRRELMEEIRERQQQAAAQQAAMQMAEANQQMAAANQQIKAAPQQMAMKNAAQAELERITKANPADIIKSLPREMQERIANLPDEERQAAIREITA